MNIRAESELSRWRRPVAALAVTAMLGTVPYKTEIQPPLSSPVSTSLQSAESATNRTISPGERTCQALGTSDPKVMQDIKDDCRSAQVDGQILLVDFGNNNTRSKVAADAAEKLLAYQTQNILTPDIHVAPASPKAKKQLAVMVKKSGGCIEDYAAKVAEESMPEIKKYDFVVANSPYSPCESKGGIAEPRGRFADIYNQAPSDFSTLAHEVGHLYGLGHADQILKKAGMYQSYFPVNLDGDNKVLSLNQYFKPKGYSYDEYGDHDNIMGQHNHPLGYENQVIPNPFHQDLLRSYSGQPLRGKNIMYNSVTISPQEAKNGVYGIWELNPPIAITFTKEFKRRGVKSKEQQELLFEKLAVVPAYEDKHAPTYKAYLANTEKGMVADIATFYRGGNPDKSNNYSFLSYGEKLLQIRMDYRGMTACASTYPTSLKGLECRAS